MTNMFDYLKWRGDLSFSVSPFNEIDNIILSMLSFIDFSGIVPPEVTSKPITLKDCLDYNKLRFPNGEDFGAVVPRENNALFNAAATSARFADTYVSYYRKETDENETKQFAAVTFILPDNSLYLAFRGTDDTLVGWKEDFAMSFDFPTESQKCAAEYLVNVAACRKGPIRTGGHSKGGNLSVYSAVCAPKEIKDRIIASYSNDGPGFPKEFIESPEYKELQDKIITYVPQSSLIGMLLDHSDNFRVIESTETNGAMQHNPYSWVVEGTCFRHLEALSKTGKRHEEVLGEWISNSTADERRKLTDTIFAILASSGEKTLSGISSDKFNNILPMVRTIANLDKDEKDNAVLFLKRFIEAAHQDKKED